jgi:hypothetical protein
LFTDSVCQKHHREITEQLLRAGVSMSYEADPKKRVAVALRAIAVYDRKRADAIERLADLLDQQQWKEKLNE